MSRQSQSKKLLEKVVNPLPKEARADLMRLSKLVFEHTGYEDLKAQPEQVLIEVLQKTQKALAARPKDTLLVENLSNDKTLILLTLRNRPFIVDSVLGELNSRSIDIELIAHPVIHLDGQPPVSLVALIFGNSDQAQRADLKATLKSILKQVCLVTNDWRSMLSRVDEELKTLRTTPPPIPTEHIAESIQFLEWLTGDNFTFMGLREYAYEGGQSKGQLKAIPNSAMGLLKDDQLHVMQRDGKPVLMTSEIRNFLFSDDPLIITKANVRSRVHRRTHLDYIGIKRFTKSGKLAGELRIVGMFTSTAYTKSVLRIPVLRYKANAVLENFNTDPTSHFGKALINILETWPRDEMFQIDVPTLSEFARIAAQLEERPRIRVLARPDKFDRFVSLVMYMPRDRYDTNVRQQVGQYLAETYDGYLSAFYPAFLENGLVRVQFIIGRTGGKTPIVSQAELESSVAEITRTWEDRLLNLVSRNQAPGFPLAYQEDNSPEIAVRDIESLDVLVSPDQIAAKFHDTDNETILGLKLFHLHTPLALSRRVPLLENLGFRVIEESTYEIVRDDQELIYLHDMSLQRTDAGVINRQKVETALEATLQAVWMGQTDDDSFNALVLVAALDWKMAAMFRAFASYLRQVRSQFTIPSMAQTLQKHDAITMELAQLFDLRFNPAVKNRQSKYNKKRLSILSLIEKVSSSDDDRILRNFVNTIEAALRTNFLCGLRFFE